MNGIYRTKNLEVTKTNSDAIDFNISLLVVALNIFDELGMNKV